MILLKLLKNKFACIKYTTDHRKAFIKLEKELLGRNTLRGYMHDVDKVFLKIFLPEDVVHKIHTRFSHHHRKAHTKKDYQQMVIDCECARFTKPDKPLNARETLEAYYKPMTETILPIIEELNL